MREREALKREILRLGPWHIDVDVAHGLSTRAFLEAPSGFYPATGPLDPRRVAFVDVKPWWLGMLERLYPDGLAGKRFLDCACNCGAYCFWSREAGAEFGFGFDVREHWIAQARFLQENRQAPSNHVAFETMDLYELPQRGHKPFDLTLFKGIFYHLPEPITGLKIAADLTREILLIDTAYRNDLPDGTMAVATEGTEPVMTGVYGLNWYPSGASTLARVLHWLGFAEVRLARRRTHGRFARPEIGRITVLAARLPGRLDAFEDLGRQGDFAVVEDPVAITGRELPPRRRER